MVGLAFTARDFYPRPPRGGRHHPAIISREQKEISIHALREEGDPVRNELYHHHQHFYPRPPRGGRRSSSAWQAIRAQFLSTPSARRATPGQTPGMPRPLHFYPRPPRGGRLPLIDGADTLRDFYPRPPRGGRRGIRDMTVLERLFLSTPSARRATVSVVDLDETAEFLSTPSARRATWLSSLSARRWRISIHALREEGDKRVSPDAPPDCISIHALREEGDILILRVGLFFFYFYPRPPRGGRLTAITRRCSMARFLSTPSARRATVNLLRQPSFSIYFYPRPPRGGRLYLLTVPPTSIKISIHALREEGDTSSKTTFWKAKNFYPRPPRGGRR